jgi:hypothetical protein
MISNNNSNQLKKKETNCLKLYIMHINNVIEDQQQQHNNKNLLFDDGKFFLQSLQKQLTNRAKYY